MGFRVLGDVDFYALSCTPSRLAHHLCRGSFLDRIGLEPTQLVLHVGPSGRGRRKWVIILPSIVVCLQLVGLPGWYSLITKSAPELVSNTYRLTVSNLLHIPSFDSNP
jgi:hypothetical protein